MAGDCWQKLPKNKHLALLVAFCFGLLVSYALFGNSDDVTMCLPTGAFKSLSGLRQVTNRQLSIAHVIENEREMNRFIPTEKPDSSYRLLPTLVGNVVHYLWCEEKIFEFPHYLSVISVMRVLDPDRIVFHYGQYPGHDKQFYNTWFEDIRNEIAVLELKQLTNKTAVCSSVSSQKNYIIRTIQEQGGIYLHHNTIILQFPLRYRQNQMIDGLTNGVEGFLVLPKGIRYDGNTSLSAERIECPPADKYNLSSNSNSLICVVKKGPFYPRDAWYRNDFFSKAVNVLLYGTPRTPVAKPSSTSLIPNIGHVIWIGGGEMDFLFYLSCLSQLNIMKVDKLYVHGDIEPRGKYWNEIKANRRVVFVKIIKPDQIFGQRIKFVKHMADVYRFIILARYGGMFTDTDAVWLKPIPRFLREYDTVASYDWPQMYSVYPDYVQCGIILGKPGSRYFELILDSFREFKNEIFAYNCLLKPYKILERHPDTLFIWDRLQVMCWKLRCHPTWYSDFRDKNADHKRYPDFNWREAHVFHWTSPTPRELTSERALRNSSTMFAEIGKHILKASGKL